MRKLDNLSRKVIKIDESVFIKSYGHLKVSEFLKPTYVLEEKLAVYQPQKTLVTFQVKLGA